MSLLIEPRETDTEPGTGIVRLARENPLELLTGSHNLLSLDGGRPHDEPGMYVIRRAEQHLLGQLSRPGEIALVHVQQCQVTATLGIIGCVDPLLTEPNGLLHVACVVAAAGAVGVTFRCGQSACLGIAESPLRLRPALLVIEAE